jgi:hypothetical protein
MGRDALKDFLREAEVEGSQTPPPSGRPSAALDDAKCESVWKMAAPTGDTLAKDKSVPYVVNFQMVDTDNNGSISQGGTMIAPCGFPKAPNA